MSKSKKSEFSPDEYVVYPAHGVGKIISIEEQEIAGISLELFVISFEKDKMTLRVPTHKATEIGMRPLSSPEVLLRRSLTNGRRAWRSRNPVRSPRRRRRVKHWKCRKLSLRPLAKLL